MPSMRSHCYLSIIQPSLSFFCFQNKLKKERQQPGAAGTNTAVLRDVLNNLEIRQPDYISDVVQHFKQTNQLRVLVGKRNVGPAIRQVQA